MWDGVVGLKVVGVGARRCCCAASVCVRFFCFLPPDLLANQRCGEAKAGSREHPACTLRVILRTPVHSKRAERDMTP